MSHPLLNEHWGYQTRGDPDDMLRCPDQDCNGFLSFEHHDVWHKIATWNAEVQRRARAKREKDRARQATGEPKSWGAPPPGMKGSG